MLHDYVSIVTVNENNLLKKKYFHCFAQIYVIVTNIFYYGAVHWLTNFTDNNVFHRCFRREAIKEVTLTYNTS